MAIKYNVRDPKYYDAKHLAHYLAKELKEKDFKIKFEAPKKETAIGAMTEEGSARGGKIKITGNPAKIAGKLPDGWSFDPATNTIKNGNKAEAELFEVEPIDKKKPIKEFVDMSDVMYAIRVARPDLKVTALDSTTFGIDLNGRSPDEIDWKKIGGSKLEYDKATGTVNVETAMGQKLSFNVMTTGAKTEKQEGVREATYTSNEDGVMENGFSEGNRQTVENTAGSLLEGLADIGHHAIAMQANLNTFSLEEAKNLFDNYNLVPNPSANQQGDKLAVQDRTTGTISIDKTMAAQLAVVYSLVQMNDRSNSTEKNPLIRVVQRGEINWDRFGAMFEGFIQNPDMLESAMGEMTGGLERGESAGAVREDVHSALGPADPTAEMSADTTPEFKHGGAEISEANIYSDRKPLSYAQLRSLDMRYEGSACKESGGVYNEQTDQRVESRGALGLGMWLTVKRYLDLTYGNDEQRKEAEWNAIAARDDWRFVVRNIVEKVMDLEHQHEGEGMEMTRHHNTDNDDHNY